MKYDNSEILKIVKYNYYKETGRKRNVLLPSKISFTISVGTIKLYIPSETVIGNMQDDSNAFEGWAVILKRWSGFSNIELEWEKPTELNNGHYQRFIFRVKEFSNAYDWFNISPKNDSFQDDLLIEENAQSTYYCNQPSQNRQDNETVHGNEAKLEHKFVEGELNKELVQMVNASFIARQLPVGLFKNEVSAKTSIFTKGKSAIDLWGIDSENNLLIFELKAENNVKVGIISELFFYISFMKNVQEKLFKYELTNDVLNQIIESKKIRAFFLTPELHPLIDVKALEILNNSSNKNIVYDSISILKDDKLRSTFSMLELKDNKYSRIEKIINNILNYTPLNSNCHTIIQGLLNDEAASIKYTKDKYVKSQLLDVIIAYITETLEDDCLSKEESDNVTQLKLLFRIVEGDFYRLKPEVVKRIIVIQIKKMLLDNKVDNNEALLKVELQGLFDLSYDQFLNIFNSEVKMLINNGVEPSDLDTFIK